MTKGDVIETLRRHQRDLRSRGVVAADLFGSIARDHATPDSDVDLVVRFDEELVPRGLAFFGYLEALRRDLGDLVGRPVDVIPEPKAGSRLDREIAKDRVRVF